MEDAIMAATLSPPLGQTVFLILTRFGGIVLRSKLFPLLSLRLE